MPCKGLQQRYPQPSGPTQADEPVQVVAPPTLQKGIGERWPGWVLLLTNESLNELSDFKLKKKKKSKIIMYTIKKNEIMPFAAILMDQRLSCRVSQTEKEKYRMTSLICGI